MSLVSALVWLVQALFESLMVSSVLVSIPSRCVQLEVLLIVSVSVWVVLALGWLA